MANKSTTEQSRSSKEVAVNIQPGRFRVEGVGYGHMVRSIVILARSTLKDFLVLETSSFARPSFKLILYLPSPGPLHDPIHPD